MSSSCCCSIRPVCKDADSTWCPSRLSASGASATSAYERFTVNSSAPFVAVRRSENLVIAPAGQT
eukprot:scaffold72535_cov65-Phaeocystis_antarctica.AAC.6